MATDRRNQEARPRRLKPEGVEPVELWDLEVPGGILWEKQEDPSFPAILAAALERLRRGEARSRWSQGSLEPCRDFARVVLAGGRALDLPATSFPVEVLAGGAGGPSRVVAKARGPRAWVLDLGQSRAKLAAGDAYFEQRRDFARLPIRRPGTTDEGLDHRRHDLAEQRQELRSWLGGLIAEARAAHGDPESLLLALPCELTDDALPGGSSYLGMAGDASLAADLAIAADGRTEVLNDAELAALAFLQAGPVEKKVLLVTLGFAVGGALISWRS